MAGKSNGSHSIENDWARAPPDEGSFWARFGKAFYNPHENSCFGRTPKRWGIVLMFYAIFYAVLAAMFAACMAGLYHTLDEKKPTYTLASSLIGDSPGVSYRPIPEGGFGFILRYQLSNTSHVQPLIDQIEDFVQPYKEDPGMASNEGCSADDNYGYLESPCFFIKVNKIYGWVPELYDASDLPAEMSEDLQEYIKGLPADEQKQVWVSCWEEHKEHSNEIQFSYPWGRGLSAAAFPFTNTHHYRSPIVAVKVTPPVGRMVVVRCRAWAKNIIYNKSIKEFAGYARIQIHIEDDNTTNVHN